MARNKSHFSGVPRTNKKDPTQDAIAENIEVLTGQRGDRKNRALLYRDLVDLDDMKRRALINSINQSNTGSLPIVSGGGIEAPHAPVNLQGTGGFTFIALTWDHPTYKGHAYAEIFRSDTDDFSLAVRIATEVTDIFSDSVNMGSSYYYWVRFVNKADMKGPTQGANGLLVVTQQSAAQILGEIGGLIEQSHLGDFLTSEVDKIADIELVIDDPNGPVQQAKNNAESAKAETEAMALNLINAALVGDENWQNNSVKLIELTASIEGVQATITSEFYTKTEANEAIAAAATTIQTMIEANGTVLSGDLASTYYTKTTADEAIAFADLALKALIEDPIGSSIGATLNNDYYTAVDADSAIAAAGDTLKSEIEDPSGTSVGATLFTNHYTIAATDQAIADAGIVLKAAIANPDEGGIAADLVTNYLTKVSYESATSQKLYQLSSEFDLGLSSAIENAIANDIAADRVRKSSAEIINQQQTMTTAQQAIADSVTALEASFDQSESNVVKLTQAIASNLQATARDLLQLSASIQGVDAKLEQDYYTASDTDSAISQASTTLQTSFDNSIGGVNNSVTALSSDLSVNYRTESNTDTAIAEANTILKAAIEDINGTSVGAALQTLSETVATNDEQWAMWGVKTTVAELTASFGLINDGVDPIFAIKGAKFAIITEQDPTVLTPVFSVVDREYVDENGDPYTQGTTVMAKALIDEAYIKTIITDEITAGVVTAAAKLTTPSINYDPVTGARSQNFSADPSGNIVAKSAVLESVTIKDGQGNVVMNSSGAIPYANVSDTPTLGSLAALNTLAYSSLTSKPTLGPFAGLTKILSTNVTTYIDSGAIGSAQIDQAYIGDLFGDNATFSGTVYANNIDGDVTDTIAKNTTQQLASGGDLEVFKVTVAAMPFARMLHIPSGLIFGNDIYSNTFGATTLTVKKDAETLFITQLTHEPDYGNIDLLPVVSPQYIIDVPASTSGVYRIYKKGNGHVSQRHLASIFKSGSTLS